MYSLGRPAGIGRREGGGDRRRGSGAVAAAIGLTRKWEVRSTEEEGDNVWVVRPETGPTLFANGPKLNGTSVLLGPALKHVYIFFLDFWVIIEPGRLSPRTRLESAPEHS